MHFDEAVKLMNEDCRKGHEQESDDEARGEAARVLPRKQACENGGRKRHQEKDPPGPIRRCKCR
jgi:hypothetical protein